MSAPHPDDLSSLLNAIAASEVIELSTSSFASIIEPKSTVLVVFYSSAYSQNSTFNSAIEEAARTLAYSGIRVGRVDCLREYTLGRAYGIKDYPTLMVFNRGTIQAYMGPLDANGIVRYMSIYLPRRHR